MPAILGCPTVVVAGEDAIFTLSDCDHDNQTATWSATGLNNEIIGSETGAVISTVPCENDQIEVEVICETQEIDGTIITEVLTCSVPVIVSKYTECSTSPSVCINAQPCGLYCECTDVTFTYACEYDKCETATIGIIPIDCPADAPITPEECTELNKVNLVGVKALLGDQCNEYWDIDCEQLCCEPHKPVFLTGDVCNCWSLTGTGVNGTTVANACGCANGKLQFNGSITVTGTGPSAFIDCVVIWGHDIASGSVSFNGITQDINLCFDGHTCEGIALPVILDFSPIQTGSFTLTINSSDGVTNCIDYIFVGRKMFTEELALTAGWENPHNLLDYEVELKESNCGILSTTYRHVPVDVTLTIECASEQWIKSEWRPYLNYLSCKNPILFQYSINRCEQSILYGWPSGSGFSQYTDPWRQTVGLNARVYTRQPKIKRFE